MNEHFSLLIIGILICLSFISNFCLVLSIQPYLQDKQKRKHAKKLIQDLKLRKVESLNELLSDNGQVILEQFNENQKQFEVDAFKLKLSDCSIWANFPYIWIVNGNWAYRFCDKKGNTIPNLVSLNYYDRLLIDKIIELVRVQQQQVQIEVGLKKGVK